MQFMGKDNVPFHTVIFPATLLGTAQPWTLMKGISVTEYLTYEGAKFSKRNGVGIFGNDTRSTGIPVEARGLLRLGGAGHLPCGAALMGVRVAAGMTQAKRKPGCVGQHVQLGGMAVMAWLRLWHECCLHGKPARSQISRMQVWRYYLLSNRPETSDADFKWADFVAKNNAELLGNLGNFVHRTLSFAYARQVSQQPAVLHVCYVSNRLQHPTLHFCMVISSAICYCTAACH